MHTAIKAVTFFAGVLVSLWVYDKLVKTYLPTVAATIGI